MNRRNFVGGIIAGAVTLSAGNVLANQEQKIPNFSLNRRELGEWMEYWANNDPFVANAVDFYSQIACSINGSSKVAVNNKDTFGKASRIMLLTGHAFIVEVLPTCHIVMNTPCVAENWFNTGPIEEAMYELNGKLLKVRRGAYHNNIKFQHLRIKSPSCIKLLLYKEKLLTAEHSLGERFPLAGEGFQKEILLVNEDIANALGLPIKTTTNAKDIAARKVFKETVVGLRSELESYAGKQDWTYPIDDLWDIWKDAI